jgi:hypothetical protein
MAIKPKRARRQIDSKRLRRRVIFWTTIAIAIAYSIIFLFTFATDANAKTVMECNVTEKKIMNHVYDDITGKPVGPPQQEWEDGTFFSWPCNDPNQNLIEALLITVLNWLAIGVSIAVLVGIIYGAVLYTTAGGNTEQTKRAMSIIRNAFIALLMYFAMWSTLNWLMPGGLFN